MAKKKHHITYAWFRKPLSIRLLIVFISIIAGFLFLNISLLREKTYFNITHETMSNVLGLRISNEHTKHQSREASYKQIVETWEHIIQSKTDYRDAHLIVAIASFNMKNCEQAKTYARNAFSLDPNHKPTQHLLEKLEQCL